MKIYMIILDGAADRKINILGNQTPLEKAKTEALNQFAQNGQETMIEIIDNQIVPESDSGAMALLSYEPKVYYPGRGTLEGLGTGFIPKGYNYVAFRINFASYDKNNKKLDRRTARGLVDEELKQLAKEINEKVDLSKFKVEFKLLAFGHHRGILCFYSKEKQLSGNISNTDPGYKKEGVWGFPVSNYEPKPQRCYPLDETEEARFTANLVNEFEKQTSKILEKSTINEKREQEGKMLANYILIRDGGEKPKKMPKFQEKFNLTLSIYGQLPAEKAIANLIGAKFTLSKALDLQLDKKFLEDCSRKLIQDEADVVFIHVKGPDEPGHDNEPFNKVKAIELIDKHLIANLLNEIKKEDIVIVTCDHATPCELKRHSKDKVPILISGGNFKKDGSIRYDEQTAKKGKCPITKAIEILPYVIEKRNEMKDDKNRKSKI
ncbi:MAG: 2,3-bisphosphoglycerate-independent phosphoglycerate mutase [Clostridia bacterium]|nr:2,3-bisphosphoglycerate-independent phosphoglycerate mutase [Clostridia bacterium]